MIDWIVVAKIVPVFIVALISPGPDFMIVSATALTRGRGDGIKTAAGIATIIAVYTAASVAGMAALFVHYFWLNVAVKVGGGLYLLYLGFSLWRASLKSQTATQTPRLAKTTGAYKIGVLTSLTNLKAIAFFASIFSLALTADTTIATQAVIGIMIPLITFVWFSCVAIGLSKDSVRSRYQSWRRVIDRTAGTILAVFGLKLIWSARS